VPHTAVQHAVIIYIVPRSGKLKIQILAYKLIQKVYFFMRQAAKSGFWAKLSLRGETPADFENTLLGRK
jgi:hypothetical protein